jgi:TonB-dependent starch-binding outer membrane protein SusC
MKKICEIVLLLFCAFPIFAQNTNVRTIKGTVTDKASRETLAGVTVVVPGTNIGFITDNDGRYSINVPLKDSVLQFSFVGYLTQVVSIKNQTQIDIFLEEDIQSLEEIVVVGYGTQKKSDLTGSISTVSVEELGKRNVSSVGQALQGQVAGVDVSSSSGTPGAGVTIRIRGIGTLNSSDPLYVVDGMMVNDIDFVNPNDIESMQVLKDASATAIYGSRGANGVVLLTTKKGTKGDAIVSFSSYYGVQNAWRSSNVMDGPTWAYLRNEALIAKGYAPIVTDPSVLPTTDWFKEISNKNAPISNIDLSVSGGSEKGNYYISVNKFSQEGTIKKTNYDRLSFRSNSTYDVKSWLKIGENITLIKTTSQSPAPSDEWTGTLLTAMMRDPVTPVKNSDGSYTKSPFNDTFNPAAIIEYYNNDNITYRTIGNVFSDITLLKGLVFKTDYSFEYTYSDARDYVPVYYVFNSQKSDISTLSDYYGKNYIQQWTNTLNYEKILGDHNFSVLAGTETFSDDYKESGITVSGVPKDYDVITIDNATGNNSARVNGAYSQLRQFSFLARLNYSYKDKYLLTSNFRADGSSKFIKGKRWDYFPSFSLGWKISEESFLKSVDFINSLKLRAGWGQIGNQGSVGAYDYLTTASSGADYIWGGVLNKGFCFPGVGNPELKWEMTATTNIGIDFSVLNSKLSGTIEYYIRNTNGMLLQVPTPGQTGIQNWPYQNAGEMRNSGMEFSLQYRNMDRAFTYSFGGNFSTIKNEVVSLGAIEGFISGSSFANMADLTRTYAGKSIAPFYGYKTDGLFQNLDEVNAQTAQTDVAPGDVRYVDADNNGELDIVRIGNPLPKFTYSFNASCSYKGFDLSATFQGVYGNDLFNGPMLYTKSSTANWNLSRDMINRWTGEGTQNDARYPRMAANDVNNSYISDRYIEDGSYLRLKTLQLGYNFNKNITTKMHLSTVRLYLNAQNLLTFTKYTGQDPEIGIAGPLEMGVDRGVYPQARVYSLGLNVAF